VEYRRSTEVYMAVLEGRADVGLVAYPSERRGLTATTFWRDKLKLICAPGHRLAGRRKIALNVLEGEKFIAFEPDLPTRREVDRRLKDAGVGVRMILEFDNIETLKRAVEIGAGVAIVPQTAVVQEVADGTLAQVKLEDADLERPLAIVHKKNKVLSPAIKQFVALLKKDA